MVIPATQNVYTEWDVEGIQPYNIPLTDIELADQLQVISQRFAGRPDASDQVLAEHLQRVSRRLTAEVTDGEQTWATNTSHVDSLASNYNTVEGEYEGGEPGHISKPAAVHPLERERESAGTHPAAAVPVHLPPSCDRSGDPQLRRLRRAFEAFASTQHDIFLQVGPPRRGLPQHSGRGLIWVCDRRA